MIAGFIGARLLHVIFERPDIYIRNPLAVFAVWRGGFVFFGGFFVAWASGWLFVRKKNQNVGVWGDLFAPVMAFGYGLGRFACLAAGCCYGKACELPWAIYFPAGVEAPPFTLRHPTQIYAILWEFLLGGILLFLEKRRSRVQMGFISKPGALFTSWIIFHSVGRLLMEVFRADFRGPQFLDLSVSTWLSFVVIIIGVVWSLRINRAQHTT